MTTSIRWSLGALSVVLLLTASPAWAQRRDAPLRRDPLPAGQVQQRVQQPIQQQTIQQQPIQQRTAAGEVAGRASLTDNQIATWLTLCNESEVQLGELGAKKAHDKDVKKFAEMLTKEHGDLAARFRKFAPDAPQLGQATRSDRHEGDKTAASNRNEGDRTAANNRRDSAVPAVRTAAAAGTQQGLPIKEICHQLAEKSLATMEQELSHKDGSQFDHCFVGSQVFGHANMLNTLQVLRPYASPELAQVIDEAIHGAQQHLTHAKKMAEQFADAGQSSDAKRSSDEKRTSDDDKE